MGFGTRQPTTNDAPRPSAQEKSPWLGESDTMDETALVLSGLVKRCRGVCNRRTHIRNLDEHGRCPGCRGA